MASLRRSNGQPDEWPQRAACVGQLDACASRGQRKIATELMNDRFGAKAPADLLLDSHKAGDELWAGK